MPKKFISRQTSLPLQPAKSPFSPRPFAPAVQAKAQDDTTPAPSVEHLSPNSNLLSRLSHCEPGPESQPIGSEVGIEGPGNQHKIQRKQQNNLTQSSAGPPTPPSASGFPIQAKLTVGAAGDKYEQEADQVARQVVNRIQAPQVNLKSGESNPVQRKISIQAFGGEGGDVSSEWEGQLNQARGGGQPLSPSVKEPMEREFGADFSAVRVHTGAQADNLARSIQAKAFTTGQDVFFGQGEYQPGSRGGQELIAHELTHVVQQGGTQLGSIQRDVTQPETTYGGNDNRSLKDKLRSLLETANSRQEELKTLITTTIEQINNRERGKVAKEKPCYNGDPEFAHILKGFKSAWRKINNDYVGEQKPLGKLVDIARGTIVCTNAAQMTEAQRILTPKIEGYKNKVGRVKNSWDQGNGYGDIKFNLPVASSDEQENHTPRQEMLICEIQVMTKQMKEAKSAWGHSVYEIVRNAQRKQADPDLQGVEVATWDVEADNEVSGAADVLLQKENWKQVMVIGLGPDANSVETKLQNLQSGNNITLSGREMTGLNYVSLLGYGKARDLA